MSRDDPKKSLSSKNVVSTVSLPETSDGGTGPAGLIDIVEVQVLEEPGMTYPKVKFQVSTQRPFKRNLCTTLRFWMPSTDSNMIFRVTECSERTAEGISKCRGDGVVGARRLQYISRGIPWNS